MGHDPKIDVRIPYEPGGRLGWDYNRVMEETPHRWVLFLDHDVLLLNPNWYHICQRATESGAGLITCKTNARHQGTGQQAIGAPQDDRMEVHQQFAKTLWAKHKMLVTSIPKASGFFMLVSKSAWEAVGGFPAKGMFREDWGFSQRLVGSGYRIACLEGLYVYHLKKRIGSWVRGEETAKEVMIRERGKCSP